MIRTIHTKTDICKARAYYEKLVVLTGQADVERPEIKEVKAALGRKQAPERPAPLARALAAKITDRLAERALGHGPTSSR